MYVLHEGEILLKERYGSSARIRHYVKPLEQTAIVVVDEGKLKDVTTLFTRIFLPHGYPKSVSKDYMAYQIWDTAQAFCSTITGTLATQEVLRGVGVGDDTATPLAATITWVIKEGCGHLGRILFAYTHGTYLDAYSKTWRLYADTLNNAAMCIEISLPLFQNYTTFALCVSTTMKAIVGVAGGSTRAALTQHHAVRSNMADVAAKDSAQETAVNFIASFTAVFLLTIFGPSFIIFFIMMALHITFNYMAVRSVCLRTLNESRFMQIIYEYLKHEVIASPCQVNRSEPIIFPHFGSYLLDYQLCGFQIKLGSSIKKIARGNLKYIDLKNMKSIYASRNYYLYPNCSNRQMHVLLRPEASVDEELCAYFHAALLSMVTCTINYELLAACQYVHDPRPFGLICKTIRDAKWSREPTEKIGMSGFVYEPSQELLRVMDEIVQREWSRVKIGLIQMGWDISKHLLIVDEWRVICQKVYPSRSKVAGSKKDTDNTITINNLNIAQVDSWPAQTSQQKLYNTNRNVIEPGSHAQDQLQPKRNHELNQLRSEKETKQAKEEQSSSDDEIFEKQITHSRWRDTSSGSDEEHKHSQSKHMDPKTHA